MVLYRLKGWEFLKVGYWADLVVYISEHATGDGEKKHNPTILLLSKYVVGDSITTKGRTRGISEIRDMDDIR
jgi:hypothetical protein